MEYLHNGYTLELCPEGFPLSTDSIVLSDFAKLPRNASVLDLGSGCGTLGLLLCAKDGNCSVTGVELDKNAHTVALHNAQRNHIDHRLTSICADLRTIPSFIEAGSYSVCISNPPYFSSGPKSKLTPHARRDDLCSMDALMESAAWALKYGGDFYLVHRPERMAELFTCAVNHKLEPKRLLLLRHRTDSNVSLIFVQCRKGASPGLQIEEQNLFDSHQQPTDYYRRLYHQQEDPLCPECFT